MKRIINSFLFLVLAFSATAQTTDEVVKAYIDATGGAANIATIKTIKMSGALSVQGIDVAITITGSQGVGYRTDISVPGLGDGFQIYTPTKGWSYMPFQGQTSVEEMSAEQLKAGAGQVDIQGPLFNYKEKGNKVELLGKETIDGVECYKLKIEVAGGSKQTTLYLDTKTYYRVKYVNGDVEIFYSNYKKTADGLYYPFTMTTPNGTIEFSSVELNQPVDPTLFKG